MRTKRTAALLVATPALLGVLALTGCSDTDGDDAADAKPVSADATTSAPADAYDEDLHAGIDEDQVGPIFPVDVQAPQQGGTYTAVVLATGSQAELADQVELAQKFAFTAGISDTGCLDGVTDSVDVADGDLVASLLFRDATTAGQFTDSYAEVGGTVEGVAEVRTYCLD
ncbi:hypothetical protein [Nocardioides sp.]|uniref:hypothetical protein n=1 Tax=Nocardioides sp. TaxID=35761 RepID=UPI002722F389|nr:hypothetical protein [Nocardioides sp.]MDO9456261.1 hypothetical protein [Nocardioides sp.]